MAENAGDQPVKLTVTHHRRPEHTHEAFINWMKESHLRAAIPVFKKHGLISYHLVGLVFSSISLPEADAQVVCYPTAS